MSTLTDRTVRVSQSPGPEYDRLPIVGTVLSVSSKVATKPRTKVKPKTERPRLHKVILINDDYTPREFVVTVLKAEFRMNEDQAYRVMMTAHRRGVCVVAVYTRDVAETKATRATEGAQQGLSAPVHDRAGGIARGHPHGHCRIMSSGSVLGGMRSQVVGSLSAKRQVPARPEISAHCPVAARSKGQSP